MEGRLQNHIRLARVPDDVWQAITSLDDSLLREIQQTFFKRMIGFPKEAQLMCIEALKNGVSCYKTKVNEYRAKYPKRKRKSPSSTQVQQREEEIEDQNEMTATTAESLENSAYEIVATQNVRADMNGIDVADSSNGMKFKEGENVLAEWKDGHMYQAYISKVEIAYHVVFVEDNKKRKVDSTQLKSLGELDIGIL